MSKDISFAGVTARKNEIMKATINSIIITYPS